jgi:uncharacterized protein (DUF2141 family)
MRRGATALIALAALPGFSPSARVDVGLAGLRSERGFVQACLTADPKHFPDCEGDPAARKLTVAAGAALAFEALPSGRYAVALFHDENGNGKLDTRFGIPTEGVGFSRNPRLMFGPPGFAAAEFAVTNQAVSETVKVKYFL